MEIIFPVEDYKIKQKVMHILESELADNVKAHCLLNNGSYAKVDKRGKVLINSQELFCEEAKMEKEKNVYKERVFRPAEPL